MVPALRGAGQHCWVEWAATTSFSRAGDLGLEATGAEPAASGTQQPLKGGGPWPALKQKGAFKIPAWECMELHKCSSETAWWPGPTVIRVRLEIPRGTSST